MATRDSHVDVLCCQSITPNHKPCTDPQSSATAISPEERGRRIALFVPVFERLVLLIRGRVRYPNNYEQWHHDERADFKRSRYAIGMVDGGARCLSTLSQRMVNTWSTLGQR